MDSVFSLLLNSFIEFGIIFFDLLTVPITEFLNSYSSGLSSALLKLIEFSNLDEFFSNFSFGGFFLGTGILFILTVNIIYWFIP